MIQSVILFYICFHFFRGASVTVTPNSKNAFAGAPDPALRRKRERTTGVGELLQKRKQKQKSNFHPYSVHIYPPDRIQSVRRVFGFSDGHPFGRCFFLLLSAGSRMTLPHADLPAGKLSAKSPPPAAHIDKDRRVLGV